ncbi:hypothetical protein P8452_04817 [Trifolium repens]|nr:hypothetical protein P8452_04817 [Trifolium repens]
MDGDHNELGNVDEENVVVGPETSNNLDLNVEQNCSSPNVVHANGSQSGVAAENVVCSNAILGIGTVFESDEHAYKFYNKFVKLSARASESVEAYQFAVRQLDEVMEGVQKILILKGEEAQVITSNSIQAYASESEPAEIFRNGHATEDQDVSNRVSGEIDRSATQRAQTTVNYNQMDSDRVLNVELPPPNTVVCISSPSSPYVSTHSVAPNSLLQGLFGFEANQVVQCMYGQPDLVLDHQSNTNLFQPPNYYSNQPSSPRRSQLSQEPINQNTYHESMPSNNQMRQGMDFDIQNPHSESCILLPTLHNVLEDHG